MSNFYYQYSLFEYTLKYTLEIKNSAVHVLERGAKM